MLWTAQEYVSCSDLIAGCGVLNNQTWGGGMRFFSDFGVLDLQQMTYVYNRT